MKQRLSLSNRLSGLDTAARVEISWCLARAQVVSSLLWRRFQLLTATTNATMHAVIAILSQLCMDTKSRLAIKQRCLQCRMMMYGNTLSRVVKTGATATRLQFLALEQCKRQQCSAVLGVRVINNILLVCQSEWHGFVYWLKARKKPRAGGA